MGLNSFFGIMNSIHLHWLFNSNHYLSHPASRLWMRIMDFWPIYKWMYLLWTDWLMESAYRHGNLHRNKKWHFKIGGGNKGKFLSQKKSNQQLSFPYFELELTTCRSSVSHHNHYTKGPTVSGRHRKVFNCLQSCLTSSS